MVTAIEVPLLLRATDSILGWFGLLRQEQRERKEQERKAIKSLYVALNETLTYFRRLEHPELAKESEKDLFERSIKTEDALSRLWMEAAIELRGVNEELSKRCFMKGVYWTERDRWTDAKIRSANIKLEVLLLDAKDLLSS